MQSGSYKNSIIAVDVSRRRLTYKNSTNLHWKRLFVLISISLFALPSLFFSLKFWDALMDLRSHPQLCQRSFSLAYFEHFLHHLDDNLIMRKASRYNRVKFKSVALGVFGRRLNDILQELPISWECNSVQAGWRRPAWSAAFVPCRWPDQCWHLRIK